MASLAFIVSIMLLFIILIGPISYLSARLNFHHFIVYLLSAMSIVSGLWFCFIGLPVWYIGLIPVYLGYISILRMKKKQTQA
jgi:hypothetical protein